MTTVQLEYLLSLRRAHSFIEASFFSNVSYQAMYKSIKSLENELGVTLVESNSRGTCLTDSGEKLCIIAEKFLEEVSRNFSRQEDDQFTNSPFHIVVGDIKYTALSNMISNIISHFPRVRFVEIPNEQIVESLIHDKRYRIAIISRFEINKQTSFPVKKTCMYFPVSERNVFVYASKERKDLDKYQNIPITALNGESFVVGQETTKKFINSILPKSKVVLETFPSIAMNLVLEEKYFTFYDGACHNNMFFDKDEFYKLKQIHLKTKIKYSQGYLFLANKADFNKVEREILYEIQEYMKLV